MTGLKLNETVNLTKKMTSQAQYNNFFNKVIPKGCYKTIKIGMNFFSS